MERTLQQRTADYLALLREGDERGLDFFYRRYFPYLVFRAERATDDVCAAESIVQEAFLRLWLCREQLRTEADLGTFLKTQVRLAIGAFFRQSRTRFHRNLLRLDEIEDYQEFMLGYDPEAEVEEELPYLDRLDEEKQSRLKQLERLLPNLSEQQQLFIKLCLKYSFNYERIAYYLGGISDYEVGLQVEKTLETLRTVFKSAQKMEQLNKPTKITLEGEFDAQQAEIFRMRYELQLSFDEISEALALNPARVKQLFVQAHSKIKASQKIA